MRTALLSHEHSREFLHCWAITVTDVVSFLMKERPNYIVWILLGHSLLMDAVARFSRSQSMSQRVSQSKTASGH